ncbi:MAG: signal peptidase I [Gemmatimonadota bacterium]
MPKPRRPWIAVLLGVLTPGLGYLYAGYPRFAAIAYCVCYPSMLLLIAGWILIPSAPLNIVVGIILFGGIYISIIVHSAIVASRQPDTFEPQRYNRWYVYLGAYLVFGLLGGTVFASIVREHFEPFRIPSGSMDPTLLIGDFIYVIKWNDPARLATDGRIVVFTSIEDPGIKVIKRVLGIPGDTLAMVAGTLHRNGREMVEPYVQHENPTRSEDTVQRAKMRAWQVGHTVRVDTASYHPDVENWGPVVVAADSVMVLGDNRDNSYDSRYFGFVPITALKGDPRVIYFSVEKDTTAGAWRRLRRSRIGQRIQ